MEFPMEVASTCFVSGANPETPLTSREFAMRKPFSRVSPQTVIRANDRLVVVDMNDAAKRLIKMHNLQPSQLTLIRQEPAVVCPDNFSAFVIANFSKIIDVGRASTGSTLSVPWPQTLPFNHEANFDLDSRTSSKPVLMNANKMSLVRGELYSLRRQLVHAEPLALYGPNWGSKFGSRVRTLVGEALIFSRSRTRISKSSLAKWFHHHPNYEGIAEDKLKVYTRFKVAIAIENSREYMSEKLLDAIFAGCVPVYVGPNVAEFGIPEGLVIESEPEVLAVSDAIARAKAVDYKHWAELASSYLSNPETHSYWSPDRIYGEISKHIFSS
jgi:hypothetical protein